MPKEYSQSDSSASSPNPSQFGSSEIRLDTPQFTAQTAVEQQQNPFDMLQGVLQSALGVVGQDNKNKEAAIRGKMELAQAKYITQQRAYSEQERIKGDANEVISNEIVRDQTALDKLYAGGLFDLAGVQLTAFEEGATSDRKKAWAAKERLQMDAHQRAYEARLEADSAGRSSTERALLAPALFEINRSALELDILSDDALANNKPTFYDSVSAENLQASLRDRLMKILVNPITGERQVGLTNWDVMSDESKQAIEAHVVQQIQGSLGRVTSQRGEVRQRLKTKELTTTVNAVSQTLVDGSMEYFNETWLSVKEAQETGEISDSTANKMRRGLLSDLAVSYKSNGGFAGSMAAASNLKGMEANNEISGGELALGLAAIDKRVKKETERAISLIESRGRAVTPQNDQHTLANIPELASNAALKEMGISVESALQFPGVAEELGKLDERQARDIAAVQRDVDQQNRADDVETIMGVQIRSMFNFINNIPGTEGYEAEKAYLKKGMDDETLSPRVRKEYASALASLTRDNRASLEKERVAGQKAFDNFEKEAAKAGRLGRIETAQTEKETKAAFTWFDTLIKNDDKKLTEAELERVRITRTLVSDTQSKMAQETTPEGRDGVMNAAIEEIKYRRTSVANGSKEDEALAKAESILRGGGGGGGGYDAEVNSVKTLVNDAFTASLKEETPEGRAKVFGEAITAISVLRETAVVGSNNEKALSLAERQLQAAKSSGLTTTTTQTRFGLTDAQNLWQATTRRAKDFPPGSPEYNAVMATGLDSMIRMGTFYPAAVKHLENMATEGGNNLTVARDFILKSGALKGEPATADMFFDQAPNLTRAVLLTKAQELVAGKVLGEETLQANLKTIMERDTAKRSSSAFVTTGKAEGASDTAVAPLKFQAELQAAMDGVYGISGLDMNGFTYNADDQQVFNTFFTEGLHSNLGADGVGNPAAAIVYAVNAMQMVGYSPRYNGGKVDFVYDPYQVVPVIVTTTDDSGYIFGPGQNKEIFDIVVKKTALAALKAFSQADFGSLDSADGVVVDLVMDSNYMGSPEGGVPFNITLPTGRVILYTEYPAGRVPLIRRQDIENYKKTQRKMPPLNKTLQEATIIE